MKDLHGKDGRKKGGRGEEVNGWDNIAQKTLQFADRNVSP